MPSSETTVPNNFKLLCCNKLFCLDKFNYMDAFLSSNVKEVKKLTKHNVKNAF